MMRRARLYLILLAVVACDAGVPAQESAQRPQLHARAGKSEAALEERVVVDAVVDAVDGSLVSGLTKADFSLTDNGVAVTDFTFAPQPEAGRPAEVVLVLDGLNSSFQDLAEMRDAVDIFLRRDDGHLSQPVSIVLVDAFGRKSDPAAKSGTIVIPLNGRDGSLRVLRGSEDGRQLAAAFARSKLYSSAMLDAQGNHGVDQRVRLSLQALQVISDAEAARPGRKIVVWIGPGWPHLSLTGARDLTRMANYAAYMINGLRRGRITLYQIDPDMIQTDFPWSSHSLNSLDVSQQMLRNYMRSQIAGPGGGFPSLQPNTQWAQRSFKLSPDTLTVPQLALGSGGMLLDMHAGRTLAQAIALCAHDADSSYVFTYALPAADKPLEYHTVDLLVHKSRMFARAQVGYYAQQRVAAVSAGSPQDSQAKAPQP